MNLYTWISLFSFCLLLFLFYLRSGARQKSSQKAWLERLETIARDNHILWSTYLPYPQKDKISNELMTLEKEQKQKGLFLKISETGEWSSSSDLLKYPFVKRLFKKLLPQITAYSRTLGLDPKFLTLTAWATISQNHQEIFKESQEDALFSGCYFLEDQASLESEGLFFYQKNREESILARFYPQAGDLLLYPSDMRQKIGPYNGSKKRICIAFNVHFGNRKKSWLISKLAEGDTAKTDSENNEEGGALEPSLESNSIQNVSLNADSSKKNIEYVHISKIK